MMNVVSFKAPKFKPLPGELTPAVINGATLPVKVEAAKRAIAACCDLSELLTWKDKLAALAAAAKMARMPEMARDVNRVHKEAIFRMGEILLTYSGTCEPLNGREAKNFKHPGCAPSPRSIAAAQAGINPVTKAQVTRLAKVPHKTRDMLISNDEIPPTPKAMVGVKGLPRVRTASTVMRFTDAARLFISGLTDTGRSNGNGLTRAATIIRALDLSLISQMVVVEKQRARKLVVEMQEILDDIDRRLGPDTSVKS